MKNMRKKKLIISNFRRYVKTTNQWDSLDDTSRQIFGRWLTSIEYYYLYTKNKILAGSYNRRWDQLLHMYWCFLDGVDAHKYKKFY